MTTSRILAFLTVFFGITAACCSVFAPESGFGGNFLSFTFASAGLLAGYRWGTHLRRQSERRSHQP